MVPELLDELELDALTEVVNLGVSRAALSLRAMVGDQVLLSVPGVQLVTRRGAIDLLAQREATKLVAAHQTFSGPVSGRALLLFPEAQSIELVRAIIGGDLTFDEMIEMEEEALAETGNIILNACLATIANSLRCSFNISLPEVLRGPGAAFFELEPNPTPDDVVVFLYIDFAVRERDIRGYIAMLMDLPSISALKGLLTNYIREQT